jgi:hypothetical protein
VDLDELTYYATPGPMTAMPPDAGALPSDAAGVRAVVPDLFVHTAWVNAYGLPAATVDARSTHTAEELVRAVRELADRPLDAPREPAERVGVVCRHFSTFAVALLRAAGVPARARCGFAGYFERGKWVDHWIVEHHDGTRWVRADFQLDSVQRSLLQLDFDPDDMPRDAFLDAGEAWHRTRAGDADPEKFGIFDMWGAWFIRGNVWRDLASLNKVEMNPWDDWGRMDDVDDDFVDGVAELARAGDFTVRRARYEDDAALRMPGRVTSFLDGNPTQQVVPAG